MHVVAWPGLRVVVGQLTAPAFESLTPTPVSVSAPVFVTRNEYAIVSPASTRPLPLTSLGVPADLTRVSVPIVEVGVLVESGDEAIAGPVGGVPLAGRCC